MEQSTAQFLLREWLPAIEHTVRPTTFLGYSTHVRRHINPSLGKIPLTTVDGPMLNDLYRALLTGESPERPGLSCTTVRRIHATLHRAFRDAVRWKRLLRNPATFADPPRAQADAVKEMTTWSSVELRRFLKFVRASELYPLWVLFAVTGMRRGEVLGLRWRDIDLQHRVLMIRQTIVAAGGYVYVSSPKTKRSVRRVALDSGSILVLEEYAATKTIDPDAWVFSGASGEFLQPTSISKMFRRLVTLSGVRPIGLHDLRHTSATLALEAGIHPKIVSERLGHSTVSLTLDIYSHAIPHLQEEAAAQLGRLIMDSLPASDD